MVILRSGSTTDYWLLLYHDVDWPNGPWPFYLVPSRSSQIPGYCGSAKTSNSTKPWRICWSCIHLTTQTVITIQGGTTSQRPRIKCWKKTIAELNYQLDQLEQHGWRDSLRVLGIPEAMGSDGTDAGIWSLCVAIKVDPPVQQEDILLSYRVGKTVGRKTGQILVNFTALNIRMRIFWAPNLQAKYERNEYLNDVYKWGHE